MKWFRWMIYGPPYRGWFGWATICVVLFIIIEAVWRGGAILESKGWFPPLFFVPEGVIAEPPDAMVKPPDAMVNWIRELKIYFCMLAVWSCTVLVGTFFVRRQEDSVSDGPPDERPRKWVLERIVSAFPYQGLSGWALMCVWLFFATEMVRNISAGALFMKSGSETSWIGIGWACLTFIAGLPYDVLLRPSGLAGSAGNLNISFFFGLANWSLFYLLGAFVRPRQTNPIYWGLRLVLIATLAVIISGIALELMQFWV